MFHRFNPHVSFWKVYDGTDTGMAALGKKLISQRK